jgi:HD-GYP domain-containing protein (c-di-GMP phosphodiesterase class II)
MSSIGAHVADLKSLKSYFSVSKDLVVIEQLIPYDLYINSSVVKNKQKFIRIFAKGDTLSIVELNHFKEKYFQLYVCEEQRKDFFSALKTLGAVDDTEKMSFIKDRAINYLNNIFEPEKEFTTELLSETINACKETVEGMVDMLEEYNITKLSGLIASLSFHDFYTFDHSINVSMYCITIFKELKPRATRSELVHVGLGGLLHDLGKVKISTSILNSPGKLTDEEFAEIKKHPNFGVNLLIQHEENLEIDKDVELELISRVIGEHHENVDGTGYPNKLVDKQIHIFSKVCAIADFFDAITTKRAYSDVLSIENAIKIMANTVDKKIDRKIFSVFEKYAKKTLSSQVRYEIDENFDPTIEYKVLPIRRVKVEKVKESFGKIKTDGWGDKPKEKFGKIKDADKKNKKAS